jgi:N-acetylmuramoyl-L-alanine amidase
MGFRLHSSCNSTAVFLTIIIGLSFFFPSSVSGEEKLGSEQFISQFLRLRNLDPTGAKHKYASKWQELAAVAPKALRSGESDLGNVFAAQVELHSYRNNRDASHLLKAERYLSRYRPDLLDRRFRYSSAQHEAFLLKGDLKLYQGKPYLARTIFEKLWKLNLGGKLREKLRGRLQGLMNQTFQRFIPSDFLETPRTRPRLQGFSGGVRNRLIVLDPGHGGEDSGARSKAQLAEKVVTLELARRIKSILEASGLFSVYITRESDIFLPLSRRTALANLKAADVFISLHVNASESHTQRGFEVYYLDNTDDESSRKLAERENGASFGSATDDLSFILSDLIQSGKLEDSIVLAHTIEQSVRDTVLRKNRKLRSRGVKKAPFYVLVGAHMPCILLEAFFIDHPYEGVLLSTDSFRQSLAESIADGIQDYFNAAG